MQAIDLHRKLQQITKQCEPGEYIPVIYIAGLCSATSEVVLRHIAELHDLYFLEYRKNSMETVRLTLTGKLANLEDYCGNSNDFEEGIEKPWRESEDDEVNWHSLFLSTAFSN